jgi:hypothetical protein
MARRKNAPDAIRIKNGLSERLRLLRTEFYGERGGPDQARTLGIPVRTWYNYENGVTVPAEIILRIVELTSVEPIWLLRGEGPKFRAADAKSPRSSGTTQESECLTSTPVKDLLRIAIHRLEEKERATLDFSFGPPIVSRLDQDESGLGLSPTMTPSNLRSLFDDDPSNEYVCGSKPENRRNAQHMRVADDAMIPIVADGAHVTFGDAEPVSEAFHEKIVVAFVDGKPVVRWFQHCGKFGLLRAENPMANPPSILVELDRDSESQVKYVHRVLWISTAH